GGPAVVEPPAAGHRRSPRPTAGHRRRRSAGRGPPAGGRPAVHRRGHPGGGQRGHGGGGERRHRGAPPGAGGRHRPRGPEPDRRHRPVRPRPALSMDEPVDVVVLGLGPGGEDAAGTLAEAGLDVVGIDGGLVGGECPYWGCVPSKMMIRAADLLAEGRRIPGMAGSSTITPDWSVVARRIRDDATDDWDDRVAVERLEGRGARFVRGWGRLDGPGRVTVGDRTFVASRAVLVNTGTKPWVPPIAGLDGTPYWTNREAIEVEDLPASLVVLGGGAIGVELAQMFARFGVAVTVVEVGPRLVAAEEPEACDLLAATFADEGIDVRAGVTVDHIDHTAGSGDAAGRFTL